MAEEVFMPRLTHDMQSGKLVRWLKREGELVQQGEVLFEVETDKAVSEVEAVVGGRLLSVAYADGQQVPVGARMALIVPEDEADAVSPPPTIASAARTGRITITPIARRLAREYGVDPAAIKGSGPGERVVEADVRAYIRHQESAGTPLAVSSVSLPVVGEAEYEFVRLTDIQRITGQRMSQSAQTIPQFTLELDVDMREARRLREHLNPGAERPVSYTALLVKAAALTLLRFPRLNAVFDRDGLRCFKKVDINVAMAVPDGLVAPVIRRVEALSLGQIQEQLDSLKAQAAAGPLSAAHISGGGFTISNLGMFGIDRFTALINLPQVAILAVGQIRDQVWLEDEGMLLRPVVTLRLSVDHRALDGAAAAPFLVELRRLVEEPYRML